MKQTLLFNFAQGGSHVNASEFHDPNPGTYDFTTQVDNFAAKVAARAGLPPWRPDTTLFVAWLGTNDVYGAFVRHLSPAVYPDILDTFFAQLDRLRALGATTFLTLTPQRTPPPPPPPPPLTRSQRCSTSACTALATHSTRTSRAWCTRGTARCSRARRHGRPRRGCSSRCST